MGARDLTIAAFLLVTPASALATLIPTLDFNNVTLDVGEGNGLGQTGSSMHIQDGLTNSLHGAGLSTAWATVTGALATKTYNGEGKVVGLTLGTADGGPTNDTFIINNGFGVNGSKSDSFTITFHGLKINSLSFDYEIFPDVSCAKGSTCQKGSPGIISPTNPWPDIELWIDSSTTTPFWSALALPADNPQRLGTSPTLYFPGGTNTLTFKDWPAEVGVNNLTINRVPEPSPIALVGLTLALLPLVRRRAATPLR